MEEIIERMIAIEEEAQKLLEKSRGEKERLGEIISGEKEKLQKEICEKSAKEQETLRSREEASAAQKIEKINEKLQLDLKRLEETAEKNRERWIENLVNTVIK